MSHKRLTNSIYTTSSFIVFGVIFFIPSLFEYMYKKRFKHMKVQRKFTTKTTREKSFRKKRTKQKERASKKSWERNLRKCSIKFVCMLALVLSLSPYLRAYVRNFQAHESAEKDHKAHKECACFAFNTKLNSYKWEIWSHTLPFSFLSLVCTTCAIITWN